MYATQRSTFLSCKLEAIRNFFVNSKFIVEGMSQFLKVFLRGRGRVFKISMSYICDKCQAVFSGIGNS